MTFWVFDFYETFICYRGYLKLNCYIGKKGQKNFLMGLKIWWIWGSGCANFKIPKCRTVFRKLTPNWRFPCANWTPNLRFWRDFFLKRRATVQAVKRPRPGRVPVRGGVSRPNECQQPGGTSHSRCGHQPLAMWAQSGRHKPALSSHYQFSLSTSYPAGCEVKKWKWKVKWSIFWSSIFFKL